jgi:hypothetical protein
MALPASLPRFLLGVLPATVLVVGAILIAVLALPLSDGRRAYALHVVELFVRLARVVIGG